jgi:oligoendopeptidase F
MKDNCAAGVTWDLMDLYAGPDDPRIGQDLDNAMRAARRFAETYRGTINVVGGPPPARVIEALAAMEAILEQAGKACVYAELLHAADVTPAAHGALVARTQEWASTIRQELLFFELEWLALADAAARRIIDDPACVARRHFLRTLRRYRPHVLSEPEERILEEKANTGARAFCRLFDEVLSSLEFDVDVAGTPQRLNESGVLALLHDHRREVRRTAADALTRGLQSNQLLLGFIFNTLVQDHGSDDRLRSYRDPMAARHLANEISGETVAALMEACEANHDVVQRYYRVKRRLLELDELADYDRYAPVTVEEARVSWPRCREMVIGAYQTFAPRMTGAGSMPRCAAASAAVRSVPPLFRACIRMFW